MVSRKHLCIFIFSLVWFLIPLLETWPGIHYSDATIYAEHFLAKPSKPCADVMNESFLYSCTLKAQIYLFGHFGFLQIIVAVLAAFCMGYSSFLLEKRYPHNHNMSWLPCVFMLLFPESNYMLALIERDIPCVWMMILALLIVAHLRIEKKRALFLLLGTLAALMPAVKQEGFIVWPFIVIELTLWQKPKWEERLYFVGTFVTTFVLLYLLFPLMLQREALQLRENHVRPIDIELHYIHFFANNQMLSDEDKIWLKKELRPTIFEEIQSKQWLLIPAHELNLSSDKSIKKFIFQKCLKSPVKCLQHRWSYTKNILFALSYFEPHFADNSLPENQRLYGIDSLSRYKHWSSYSFWKRDTQFNLSSFPIFVCFLVLLIFCLIQSKELNYLLLVIVYFICIVILAPNPLPRYYYFFPTLAMIFIPFVVKNFLAILQERIKQLFSLVRKMNLSKKLRFNL
ncbi:MAG: hypothetical protein IT287_09115, partial [Bdellovibrionaceae bacterium]|nr:hypothetical protein [Pseudobdellovibrionaceae bacterium]